MFAGNKRTRTCSRAFARCRHRRVPAGRECQRRRRSRRIRRRRSDCGRCTAPRRCRRSACDPSATTPRSTARHSHILHARAGPSQTLSFHTVHVLNAFTVYAERFYVFIFPTFFVFFQTLDGQSEIDADSKYLHIETTDKTAKQGCKKNLARCRKVTRLDIKNITLTTVQKIISKQTGEKKP